MWQRRQQSGFTLLEVVVALVILSFSLVTLYQATTNATRNVRRDERYAYAILLAESLLAEHPAVPAGGLNASGRVEDFRWRLASTLIPDREHPDPELHALIVAVSWDEDTTGRTVRLVTVVPVEERS